MTPDKETDIFLSGAFVFAEMKRNDADSILHFVHLNPVHCHLYGIVVGVGCFHPNGANLHVYEQEVGRTEYVRYLRFAPY